MGLQSTFKKAAQSIVKAFGDVPLSCTYTVYGEKSYDEETDTVTTPETDYSVTGFFGSFSLRETEKIENIQAEDVKAMIAVDDLGVEPSTSDKITITSTTSETYKAGNVYNVMNYRVDPAEALYTLHLRAVT